MSARRDDGDLACFRCARGVCLVCLEADRQPVGRRSCCCGAEDEVDQWADDTTDDEDDD